MKFAVSNNRVIPERDKIFELNMRAKDMIVKVGKENVVNGTIGALLDDDKNLAIIGSVVENIKKLNDVDFAEYASIGGLVEFKEAVYKATFDDIKLNLKHEIVATPGGTGAIKNTIANYTKINDKVITSDWYWSPYKTICEEQFRELITYELFNENRSFNFESFRNVIEQVSKEQENIVILLNTPAHNPTGYALSNEEWNTLVNLLNEEQFSKNKIALFIDVAYLDFAGEPRQVRTFFPILQELKDNILSIVGYSASKTFTLYGMRTGAMIGLHKDQNIVEEFRKVCEFSSRNSWSNCNRSGQKVIANIYKDENSLKKVDDERKAFRDMLMERGRAFEEFANEKDIDVVPFLSGFFICIAHDNPEYVSEELAKKGIFVVPLKKGIRISIASITKDDCKKVVDALAEIL